MTTVFIYDDIFDNFNFCGFLESVDDFGYRNFDWGRFFDDFFQYGVCYFAPVDVFGIVSPRYSQKFLPRELYMLLSKCYEFKGFYFSRQLIIPHGSYQRILDVTSADFSCKVVHVDRPDHGPGVTVLFDPFHFMPDGSFVVEADPLVSVDQVGNLHLIVPNVGGSFSEHFADLKN